MKHELQQRLNCPVPAGVFTALGASVLLHSVLVLFLVGLKGAPPVRTKPAIVQINLKSVRLSPGLEGTLGMKATDQPGSKARSLAPQSVPSAMPVAGREQAPPDQKPSPSATVAKPASALNAAPAGISKKIPAQKIEVARKTPVQKPVTGKAEKPLVALVPAEPSFLDVDQPTVEQEAVSIAKIDNTGAKTRFLPPQLSVDRAVAISPQDVDVNDDVDGEAFVVEAPQEESPSGAADALREEYLSFNFGSIRDKVRDNLRYPTIARRQGWTGRVEIEFTISLSGTIDNKRILSSSGYPLLDRQALRAVDVSAPFPPPAVIATVILPVTFSLE
ncbi:energy transducer TonB [Pelobacter seleniigenes]|uniref:energy transducer TonB n=1 Tax=Pelobacter seleniigenes TaxID=407188 RepID=UPI0004A778F3|nr:energy transducer TonB [Pelobacter seleniigenes]